MHFDVGYFLAIFDVELNYMCMHGFPLQRLVCNLLNTC